LGVERKRERRGKPCGRDKPELGVGAEMGGESQSLELLLAVKRILRLEANNRRRRRDEKTGMHSRVFGILPKLF